MERLVLSIFGLLLIAACNGSSPLAAQTSTVVPMNVQVWAMLYSPGMPPHATPQIGGGWYFDFPTDPNSVHYVLAAVSMAASGDVHATISVTTTGMPVFASIRPTSDSCCNRKATTYPEGMEAVLQVVVKQRCVPISSWPSAAERLTGRSQPVDERTRRKSKYERGRNGGL
jgi:hypothetical protein